jgi:hypothetical protein
MKQVATIQSGLPNVYLESQAFNTIIETDLRLALNEGLDKLILDAIAGSGFQAPGRIRSSCRSVSHHHAAGNRLQPGHLLLTRRIRRRSTSW